MKIRNIRLILITLMPLMYVFIFKDLRTLLLIPLLSLLTYIFVSKDLNALAILVNALFAFSDLVINNNGLALAYLIASFTLIPLIPKLRLVKLSYLWYFATHVFILLTLAVLVISLSAITAYSITHYTLLSEYVVEIKGAGFYALFTLIFISMMPLVKSVLSFLNPFIKLRMEFFDISKFNLTEKISKIFSLDFYYTLFNLVKFITLIVICSLLSNFISLLIIILVAVVILITVTYTLVKLRIHINGLNFLITCLVIIAVFSIIFNTNLIPYRFDESGLISLVKLINEVVAKLELGVK